MFDSTPTLALVISDNNIAELVKDGCSPEEAIHFIGESYAKMDLSDNILFTAECVYDLTRKQFIQNFKAIVASTFEIDGTIYLKLNTGDVIMFRTFIRA